MRENSMIKIGNKVLGKGPTFIVAEIGSNHGGDVRCAKELMQAAKESGADCVKFQGFLAEELVSRKCPSYSTLKKLELGYEDYKKIKEYSKELRIPFFSTCTNEVSLGWLKKIGIPVFKIASPNMNCLPLIHKVGLLGKPIFLSTGMCYESEIRRATETLKRTGNNKIVIMHCVSDYPARAEEINIRYLERLKGLGYMVGYSDHTLDSRASVLAVALGAVVIEKHFGIKLTKRLPDSSVSLTPKRFKRFVRVIRDAEKVLGMPRKRLTRHEIKSRGSFRRSIHARLDIPKGARIKDKDLKVVRPDSGIAPQSYYEVVGCKARIDIKGDSAIKWRFLVKK